jgi:hypothetical protein
MICLNCKQSLDLAKPGSPKPYFCRICGAWYGREYSSGYAAGLIAADVYPGDRYKPLLFDLLAVLHRDGGHFTARHGVEVATKTAMHIASSLIHATCSHCGQRIRGRQNGRSEGRSGGHKR